jgi:hypothetical protein
MGEHILINQLGLHDILAVSLASRAFLHIVRALAGKATCLHVKQLGDATFATAAFVGRQMALRRLVILGSRHLDLDTFRALAAAGRPILVGHLDKESALVPLSSRSNAGSCHLSDGRRRALRSISRRRQFVGAALAATDGVLVTSDERRISLRALRESAVRSLAARHIRTQQRALPSQPHAHPARSSRAPTLSHAACADCSPPSSRTQCRPAHMPVACVCRVSSCSAFGCAECAARLG